MARVISHLNLTPDPSRMAHEPAHRTARTKTATTQGPGSPPPSDPAADFRALFSNGGFTTGASNNAPPPAPTAESVFGPNPWLANPTAMGPNGVAVGYNPYYFATPETAAKVAQMVGGRVVQTYQFTPSGGAFAQQQSNQMVQLPDGRLINPGLVASFYTHGYPQSYIDLMISSEVRNA